MSRRLTEKCSVEGCGESFYSLGYCRNHHSNLKRNGHPTLASLKSCKHCLKEFRSSTNTLFCSDECRFINKVDMSQGHGPNGDCWEWTGTKHGKGYGHFSTLVGDRKLVEKAHRFAFRIFCDHDPGNLMVCHTCDNPKCVNPDHLFLATNKVNLLDRQRKQRQARGERSPHAKLTEGHVRALRAGVNPAVIAAETGASASAIRRATIGITWRHVGRR